MITGNNSKVSSPSTQTCQIQKETESASKAVSPPHISSNLLSPIKSIDMVNVKTPGDVPADLKQEDPESHIKEEKQENTTDNAGVNCNSKLITNNNELLKIKKEDQSPQLSPKEFGNDSKAPIVLSKNFSDIQKAFNEKVLNNIKKEERTFQLQQENIESQDITLTNQKNVSSYGNCMDYIQHQNHIFVFSTQLANKGAESVLTGQFPTIIAYHCMQPSTKHFLDEFFIKNPLKMSKFQRQSGNSNNSGHVWNSNCHASLQLKCNNKNNQNLHSTMEKSNQHMSTVDSQTLLQNNEDFLGWETSSHSSERDALKIFEESENAVNAQNILNKSMPSMESSIDVNIPSLQGVKVPDENLTPQQRQHREEQLAKLKKMNQFLFPENASETKVEIGNENQNITLCNKIAAKNIESVLNIDPISNTSGIMDCNSNSTNEIQSDALRSDLTLNNVGGSNKRCLSDSTHLIGMNSNITCNPQFQDETSNTLVDSEITDFNQTGPSLQSNGINSSKTLQQDISVNNLQDWQKLQSKATLDSNSLPRSIQPNSNSRIVGNTSSNTMLCASSQNVRNIPGPPPPYHSTQRTTSVQVSVHSPNPSSPNQNTISTLPIPSPRATGNVSHVAGSPNIHSLISLAPNSTSSNTSPNSGVQSKGCFTADETNNANLANRNRATHNALNNSSHPIISHVNSKELESFNPIGNSDESKMIRYSSQRSKTPISSENRYTSSSPGLNYSQQYSTNSYKSQGVLEVSNLRQNCLSNSSHYSKRSENLPLNPLNTRNVSNKTSVGFDPISSLAQMSQQLTNCSTLSPSMGNGSSGHIISHSTELHMDPNPNLDHSLKTLDNCLEGCNLATGNPINNSAHLNATGHGNCQSSPGNLGQRMSTHQKICNNFNAHSRDPPPGNFSNIVGPSPRMFQNRMTFGYNVPANVQVRASTPNTIQYLPVRPQNNNCGMRMTPGLEFLQRYTHTSMPNSISPLEIGQINQVTSNDPNKGPDTGNQTNFFQNCSELNVIGSENEQSIINFPEADLNVSTSTMRGVRQMRSHGIPGPKIENIQEVNEASSDVQTGICNVYNSLNSQHSFQNTQQKSMKQTSSGCNNIQTPNEHISHIHSQINSPCLVNPESNYKFMSSAQSDMKYAQQYHSFQQQLYATRVQQTPSSSIANTNPFFTTKQI